MKLEDRLLLALEFLTEGDQAVVPQRLSKAAFGKEAFLKETIKMKKTARPWTQGSGIQGLGIGQKVTKGKETEELALRVYVVKKKPRSKVKNRVPKQVSVPDVGKMTTDVLEIGRVVPEIFTSRIRPAPPGSGVGHFRVTVGTFGCLVRRKGRKRLHILSNSHVLADEGTGRRGDRILQPGRTDGGLSTANNIGRLSDWVPFVFSGSGYPNRVDAAIAKVRKASVTDVIRILGIKPVGISRTVRRGMTVRKVGRTTDLTTGIVSDVNYRLALNYKRPGGGTGRVGLRDQVLCTRYTAGGDSGSAVLNSRNRIVGLHFAGSPSTSIFNRIGNVFDELNIELA